MPNNRPTLANRILADLNVATFIKDMGLAVATAQRALDDNSVQQTLTLGSTVLPGMTQNLLELGLQPAFYHFQYADLEMHLNVYYSLSVDVGVNVDYSSTTSDSDSSFSSDATPGTVTLTLQDGAGIPPKAVVNVVRNEAGMLTLAGQSFTFDTSGASADVVVTRGDSLWESSIELARELRNNAQWSDTEQGKALDGVTHEFVPGATTKATTNAPARYVCGAGMVDVRAAQGFVGSKWLVAGLTSLGSNATKAQLGPADTTESTVEKAIDAVAHHTAKTWEEPVLVVAGGTTTSAVHFDTAIANAGASAADNRVLEAVAAYLLGHPTAKVKVDGYADYRGSNSYNDDLSERRARWVKDQLVDAGVSGARITAKGHGELPGTTLAFNRRVTFTFEGVENGFVAPFTGPTEPSWTEGVGTAVLKDRERTGPDPVYVVTFGGKRFTEVALGATPGTREFAIGMSPEETATNLAAAINLEFSTDGRFGAFAELERVWLHGPGDYARLTLFAHSATAPTLSASGSIRVASGFSGGQPPATPQPRDFVVIESVRLVAIAQGAPDEVNSFRIGATAEETATNLADLITSLGADGTLPAGIKAQAAGKVVTVSGPAGTLVGASNRAAFAWSANRIGGKNATTRTDKSDSTMKAFNMDAHAAVKYDFGVSGSSTIKARLVAVPAPPQFLQAIGDYLDRWYP